MSPTIFKRLVRIGGKEQELTGEIKDGESGWRVLHNIQLDDRRNRCFVYAKAQSGIGHRVTVYREEVCNPDPFGSPVGESTRGKPKKIFSSTDHNLFVFAEWIPPTPGSTSPSRKP